MHPSLETFLLHFLADLLFALLVDLRILTESCVVYCAVEELIEVEIVLREEVQDVCLKLLHRISQSFLRNRVSVEIKRPCKVLLA